jgi:asparagine synthase (glutamine-hydrolysing)
MIRINLDERWVTHGATRTRGYAFDGDQPLSAAAIAERLDRHDTGEGWRAEVARLNGCFSAVSQRGERVFAAVDRVRTIPLFYGSVGEEFFLSDHAAWVRENVGDVKADAGAAIEFLLTGYVTGADTLFPNVKQIQAAETLIFETTSPQIILRGRYYEYRHRDDLLLDTEGYVSRLDALHHDIAVRLISSLGGRQAVLPLSGGFDSRLIAVMLKEHGYENVVCYTYGVPGNWEMRISRQLAEYLGFRWEFVAYSGQRWREWGANIEFNRYCRDAGNLASIPHVQDWPAVFELQRRGAIESDCVFIPGHSGDFVAGSHIPPRFADRAVVTRTEQLEAIFAAHYSLWPWPQSRVQLAPTLSRRIEAITGALQDASPERAADQFEYWDINERQAKFICNSVRVYDFFGYDWRLPLFDLRLLDFWTRVPLRLRVGRQLYFEYARRRQNLPVSMPNVDRGPLASLLVQLIGKMGLRTLAKAVRHRLRRARWEREYENCADPPLAWFTLVDRELFKRTYTGEQTLHAYLARKVYEDVRYLD